MQSTCIPSVLDHSGMESWHFILGLGCVSMSVCVQRTQENPAPPGPRALPWYRLG